MARSTAPTTAAATGSARATAARRCRSATGRRLRPTTQAWAPTDMARTALAAIALAAIAVTGPSRVVAAAAGPASSAPGLVDPSELEIVEHTVSRPPRGKDADEDFWIQYQIWGEMKNRSSRAVRAIAADVTFFDAQGKSIAIDSITTAVK